MADTDCKLAAPMRHTRIVATIGPATSTPEMLDALLRAGADIFRLNFSHGTHESHRATIEAIRAAEARRTPRGRHPPGPGGSENPHRPSGRRQPIALAKGDRLTIRTGDRVGGPGEVFTTYAPLAASVVAGQQLLLDDGRIVLRVEGTDGVAIQTTVVHGSQLGEHKGITAPGVALPSDGLTAKDDEDLRFGIAAGVDMIALSFVQHVADVRAARAVLDERWASPPLPIVAKLERPQAIEQLDPILAEADAVMVARGDLGLEVPLERVPRLQKEITRRARAHGRPVIVATQVLESMRKEPRPTRAEVSDAANAVDDGVDAIMLAGETASGAFPVESVQTLDAIIREAEQLPPLAVTSTGSLMQAEHGRALCEAAVTLADRGQADGDRRGDARRQHRADAGDVSPASVDPGGHQPPRGGTAAVALSRSRADRDAVWRERRRHGRCHRARALKSRSPGAWRRSRVRERARGPAAARGEFSEAASGLARQAKSAYVRRADHQYSATPTPMTIADWPIRLTS